MYTSLSSIITLYYPMHCTLRLSTNIIEKWVKVEPEGGLGKELISNLLKLVSS